MALSIIWRDVLGMRDVSVEDNFFLIGGNSILLLQVTQAVSETFSRTLPLYLYFHYPTIEEFAAVLREETKLPSGSTALPLRASAAMTPPLFLVHDISGDITWGFDFVQLLAPERAVYAFQPPGLYDDSLPIDDIQSLAVRYADDLVAVAPGGTYLLGGYCSGGLIALEMATALAERDVQVPLVILFDAAPPRRKRTPSSPTELLYGFFAEEDVPVTLKEFAALDQNDQLEYILDGWKQLKIAPPAVSVDFVRRHLRIHEASERAFARYEPKPYAGSVVLFVPGEAAGRNDAAGWRERVLGKLHVQGVPGDHFEMFMRPAVTELARQASGHIAHALRAPSGQFMHH
ncbi:thioesterase domain-containing protein [Tenggerimyces flavus]|uniref:Thioesterase domain-containing protein n=1 Tax=Tenggerimyces flavus TaxID=1708749 RepID=A0ABV7YJD2_9ACTN|nr:thioesterase domain-containing protein [Tenggerimyces flavus]MBM7789568.1 thioesterase domain-containing protein [Tenggerimyces flavus]